MALMGLVPSRLPYGAGQAVVNDTITGRGCRGWPSLSKGPEARASRGFALDKLGQPQILQGGRRAAECRFAASPTKDHPDPAAGGKEESWNGE
jgi:hypothetical protein